MSGKVNIVWLRRDLRLEDNHALSLALRGKYPVLVVFLFDRTILDQLPDKNDARVSFIYRQIEFLKRELQQYGSDLLVGDTTPELFFEQLSSRFTIHSLFYNRDYEPYAVDRDRKIDRWAHGKGIDSISLKDHVVLEPQEIRKPDHTAYSVFTPYYKKWREKLADGPLTRYPFQTNNLLKTTPLALKSLQDLGFNYNPLESTFKRHIGDFSAIHYEQNRDFPAKNATSRLSTALRFGTVSIRSLVAQALKENEVFLKELAWREFFISILHLYPHVVTRSFKPQYDAITWRNDLREFELWQKGLTGYPLVDAAMRELNETGYMHNRMRMVAASFLCKHLLIDWRWGESYFAQKLMDYELASNNGNWQWVAGSGCDAAPYFRVFNPYSQQEKFDPQLTYTRRWVRELGLPEYPKPIVEHSIARDRALRAYKEGLASFSS